MVWQIANVNFRLYLFGFEILNRMVQKMRIHFRFFWCVNLFEIYSIRPAAVVRSVFANQSNDVLLSNQIPVSTASATASLAHFGNRWPPLMANSHAHIVRAYSRGHHSDADQPNLSARQAFSVSRTRFSLSPSPYLPVSSKQFDSLTDKYVPFAVPSVQLLHGFSKKDHLLMEIQNKLNVTNDVRIES